MRHGDLIYFILTHQRTEARNHSPKKQGTLTEPHYMFCGTLGFRGTPVEEHWCRPYTRLRVSASVRIIIPSRNRAVHLRTVEC